MSHKPPGPDLDRYPELQQAWIAATSSSPRPPAPRSWRVGGALFRIAADDLTKQARAEKRRDGRPRLPPGQRVLEYLRPMGGDEGDGDVQARSSSRSTAS